ncbi:MAG: LysM peptidoglycan-binding domain-containing protein [Acidobacteriota bacterium]
MRMPFLTILLAPLALTLSLTAARAADPQKLPADFRGLAWGVPPSSLPDLKVVDREGDIIHYERPGEKKELGGIALKNVTYSFFKNQFYHAEIGYEAPGAYAALQAGLEAKYGPPDSVRQKTDAAGHAYEIAAWSWPGALFIGHRHDKDAPTGRIFYFYAPLTEASAKAQGLAPTTAAGKGGSYLVKKGDSLERIAKTHGVSEAELTAANPGLTDKNLKAGATINLPGQAAKPAAKAASLPPPGNYIEYTIKEGEILSKVANAHGARIRDVIAANPDINPDNVRPGTVLRIPVKKDAPADTAKEEAVEIVAPPAATAPGAPKTQSEPESTPQAPAAP